MLDHDKALMGNRLLGQHCTPLEAEELAELARASKFKGVDYGASILSLAQSIANDTPPGQKMRLLMMARRSKDERDAQTETFGFVKDRIAFLSGEVQHRGRPEGDAKRQFREEMIAFMKRGWPLADESTLFLTLGQAFGDTPGVWAFDVPLLVVALRNLRRFG